MDFCPEGAIETFVFDTTTLVNSLTPEQKAILAGVVLAGDVDEKKRSQVLFSLLEIGNAALEQFHQMPTDDQMQAWAKAQEMFCDREP